MTERTTGIDDGSVRPGTLIVGASQAGMQIAVSLREGGYTDAITMVGAEPHLPYQRPPLSKKIFTDPADAAALVLRSESFYQDRGIAVILGRAVVSVERDQHGGHAVLSDGTVSEFQHLALAVGAGPRRLAVAGADLAGVIHLRDIDDAVDLSAQLANAKEVVVVGGGFVGLETAAAMRARGARVTVVEAMDRLMARAVAPVVSRFFLQAHLRRGVDVLLNAQLSSLIGDELGRVTAVTLTDGRVLQADLVVVGIGIEPRTELAEYMGLSFDSGIRVDEMSRTSDGLTVAAGDCTIMPNPVVGRSGSRRIESVHNAVEQSKNAAATLLGRLQPYRLVPWFWSDQADLKLQMVGDVRVEDEVVIRGDMSNETFTALFYNGAELTGAQCVNRPVDFIAVRSALARGLTIASGDVTDVTVPLKRLATGHPQRKGEQSVR